MLAGTLRSMQNSSTHHTGAPETHFDPTLVRTLLGYACHQAFMFALFYMGWNSALTVGGFTFERIDLLITLLAAAVTLIVLRAVALRVRDVLLNRSLMWCYAVLLAIGSSVSLPAEYGLASMVMEGVLVGVPFACMLAAWGRALGARSHGESSRGVLLATAVAAVFTFLLAVVCSQAPLAAAVANLLPFGSAWALVGIEPLLSSERVEENTDSQKKPALTIATLLASKEQRAETHRISRKVVGGSVVFGLAGGLMETYASDPGSVATPTFAATLLLLALFCAGSLQVVGMSARRSGSDGEVNRLLVGVYRLALLLMMAG